MSNKIKACFFYTTFISVVMATVKHVGRSVRTFETPPGWRFVYFLKTRWF